MMLQFFFYYLPHNIFLFITRLLEPPSIDELKAKIAEAFPRETDQHDGMLMKLKKIVRRRDLVSKMWFIGIGRCMEEGGGKNSFTLKTKK